MQFRHWIVLLVGTVAIVACNVFALLVLVAYAHSSKERGVRESIASVVLGPAKLLRIGDPIFRLGCIDHGLVRSALHRRPLARGTFQAGWGLRSDDEH